MADQKLSGAIWGNEAVVESMHQMHSALNEWERVGAAEEIDLDEMDQTVERFRKALGRFNDALDHFANQNPMAAWLQKNIGEVQQTGASSFTVRVHKRVAAEERLSKRAEIFKKYQSQIRIADSNLCSAISHLADMAQSHGEEQYDAPKIFRAVTGLIHALRQVEMVK